MPKRPEKSADLHNAGTARPYKAAQWRRPAYGKDPAAARQERQPAAAEGNGE
ncbi:hypothetical protein D3C81_2267300 [compost metagenome]